MFDLELHSKIRQAQLREYAELNRFQRQFPQKPNRWNQMIGRVLTRLGTNLIAAGRKLLSDAIEAEPRPLPHPRPFHLE